MYIQLQLKTECIEEEKNRDKYGIRFCKNVLFKKIFFNIKIISFTSWKTCTKRSEESKKGIKIYMRVRLKKE